MEEKYNNIELGNFSKKYIQEIPKEEVLPDFTTMVMQQILQERQAKTFSYSALISKKGWFLITGIIVALLIIPFKTSEKINLLSSKIEITFFENIQLPNFSEILSVSNTTLYAVFFFSLMLMVQMVYLKKYFERKID